MKIARIIFCTLCCVMIAVQVSAQTLYSVKRIPLSGPYGDLNNNDKVVGVCQGMHSIEGMHSICVWDPVNGVVDLGIPTESWAKNSINDSGQVVGQAHDIWFIYDPINGVIDFDTLVTNVREVSEINDSGQVVGRAATTGEGGYGHAFLWDPDQGMVDLGGEYLRATGINNLGQVVGRSGTSKEERDPGHAFLWDATSAPSTLY